MSYLKRSYWSKTYRMLVVIFALVVFGVPAQQTSGASYRLNPTSGSAPDVVAYILTDADFETPLPEKERQDRLDTNLPVPAIREALPVTTRLFQHWIPFLSGYSDTQTVWAEGWAALYIDDFETNFPVTQRDDCELEVLSNTSQYQWGRAALPAGGGSGQWGVWPAAGGDIGLDPQVATYPELLTTQIICTFPTLDEVHNVLTQFDIWQDAGDIGDNFFVGFHTGETGDLGQRLFYGYEWTQSRFDDTLGEHTWESRRIYYPDAARRIEPGQGTFAVMWQFQSDANRREDVRGVWLDNLRVERYQIPETSRSCETLDPSATLLGAPGDGDVSKGLNLPTYLEDDLPGRIERLGESDVHWIRLEFALQPHQLIEGYVDGELVIRSLDLKYFDEMIDALCAEQIAVLGLLDYSTLARQDWRTNHSVDATYIADFEAITALLVLYYEDRIGVWEVWNEPDYTETRLTPASYADLLVAIYDKIKYTDAGDKVIFGSLGGADTNASNYLYDFYDALGTAYPGRNGPYDIFGIHPYMSTLYRDGQGRLIRDPNVYLRYESPTIIHKFQEIITGTNPHGIDDGHVEIWVTELGWNSAKGYEYCSAIVEQLVTSSEQAQYLEDGYHILLQETAWADGMPGVTKVFWYQYRDTGVILNCADTSGIRPSPSWYATRPIDQGIIAAGYRPVHWWFGLYDGAFLPKPSQLTFRDYTAQPPEQTISIVGEDVVLTWHHLPGNTSYEIWRSSSPYFEAGDPTSIRLKTIVPSPGDDIISYEDVGANSDSEDYFYLIRAANAISTADTNTVGKVSFVLVQGT